MICIGEIFFQRVQKVIKIQRVSLLFLVQEKVNEILQENAQTENSISETRQLIDDYHQGIVDVLNPKLQELKREGDSRISLASEKRKL